MSGCPGLHCPGCRDGGDLAKLIGGAAAVAVVCWLAIQVLWLIAVIVVVPLLALIVLLVWMARRGADVATVSHPQALPIPERPALTGRPVRALPEPAPQQITNIFYGYSAAEVARAVAEQQAINERR